MENYSRFGLRNSYIPFWKKGSVHFIVINPFSSHTRKTILDNIEVNIIIIIIVNWKVNETFKSTVLFSLFLRNFLETILPNFRIFHYLDEYKLEKIMDLDYSSSFCIIFKGILICKSWSNLTWFKQRHMRKLGIRETIVIMDNLTKQNK